MQGMRQTLLALYISSPSEFPSPLQLYQTHLVIVTACHPIASYLCCLTLWFSLTLSCPWSWFTVVSRLGVIQDTVWQSEVIIAITYHIFIISALQSITFNSVFWVINLFSIEGITWHMIQASPDKDFCLIVYLRFNQYVNAKNYLLPYSKYLVNY